MAYTTIDDPEAYFQVKLYTGDGADPTRAITLDGDTDMSPNLILFKNRGDWGTRVIDSVRGVNEVLVTHATTAESTDDQYGYLASFDSDGFTTQKGSHADQWNVNKTSDTYVAWCWKESAATAGFDIIAYAGQGIDTAFDVSHNLSAVPDWIMIKDRSVGQAWRVYHKNMTTADPYSTRMVLAEDGAETTNALGLDADPTSSVINIGTGTGCTNASGANFICYAWKEIQGFSKFGTVESNGNVDGSFCWLGFRAAFIMIKSVDSTSSWQIFDNKREGYNVDNDALVAEASTAEVTTDYIDILSNGFKIRTTSDPGVAETYIYMAFAEAPFVNSNGVPCNAR